MKTKTIELYDYAELSAEAKARALQEWRAGNTYPDMADAGKEQLAGMLDENGITAEGNTIIYYSLSHSQGDGAMFKGMFEWKGHRILIEHFGRYYHSYSKHTTFPNFTGEEKEGEEEAIAKGFETIYQSICAKLQNWGYAYMEQEDSEETFIEVCEANEYTFLSTGVMEN